MSSMSSKHQLFLDFVFNIVNVVYNVNITSIVNVVKGVNVINVINAFIIINEEDNVAFVFKNNMTLHLLLVTKLLYPLH